MCNGVWVGAISFDVEAIEGEDGKVTKIIVQPQMKKVEVDLKD